VRIYLHSSSEVIALGEPLSQGLRVKWFVRRPSDVQEGYSGSLAERLGIDPALVAAETFAIEDRDGYFPNADDDDALWIEGTVVAWSPDPVPVVGHVLVDLHDTTMTSYVV